jgi:AbrB family looped-hinge helix DNA binding protein
MSSPPLEVKISSKGQVVLPKETRRRLGLKPGDKLRLEVNDQTKTIVMQPSVEPPKEIFVRAGSRLTRSIMQEADRMDERKTKRLLKAIGVSVD